MNVGKAMFENENFKSVLEANIHVIDQLSVLEKWEEKKEENYVTSLQEGLEITNRSFKCLTKYK